MADLQNWEQEQFIWLKQYLYPEDQTEERAADRTDILVYLGTGRLGDLVPEGINPPEGTEDEEVTEWTMGRDVGRLFVKANQEDDWNELPLAEDESGRKKGQNYQGRYYMRTGNPTRIWLAHAALYVDDLQAGRRNDDQDSRREELLGYVEDTRDNMPSLKVQQEKGDGFDKDQALDITEETQGQFVEISERLQDGETRTELYIRDPNVFERLARREQKPEPLPGPSPYPFDPSTGLADVPSDPFTFANVRGLMQASGSPSDERFGEWTEDDLGRPVYRYQFNGKPWKGAGQLSLIEQIDTQQAWKLLAEADLDAVTLYFLFLAYASDTSRRGSPDEPFRISKEVIFHFLGLHKRTDLSLKEKIQHVWDLNKYLNSFRVQLTRLTHNGDAIRKDVTSPAQLWDTFLRGVQVEDLFGEVTHQDFQIQGREGAWASEFLHHEERGGRNWTKLPLHVLEDINRRNEWPRRILFHSLLFFRINGGGFNRTASQLMGSWCREDIESLSRRTRYRRKKKLINALDELKAYGFKIDDSQLRIGGRPFDEWLSRRVRFDPPDDMTTKHIQGKTAQLPSPSEDAWNGRRIKALRKTHLGESQEAFGKRFNTDRDGISQGMISLWECGNETPKPEHERTLDHIAEASGFDG